MNNASTTLREPFENLKVHLRVQLSTGEGMNNVENADYQLLEKDK